MYFSKLSSIYMTRYLGPSKRNFGVNRRELETIQLAAVIWSVAAAGLDQPILKSLWRSYAYEAYLKPIKPIK